MTILERYPFYPWLVAPSVVLLVLMCLLARRRMSAPGAWPFLLFIALSILWVMAGTLGLIARTDSAMFFWFRLEKTLVLPIVTAQFCFALEYARAEAGWSRGFIGWLVAAPLLFAVLIWTNQAHHLVWANVWIDRAVHVTLGPGHWVAIAYALLLSLGHLTAMAWLFLRSPRHRWIATGLFIAPLISRAAAMLNVTGWNPVTPLNPMLLATNITLIPYALALFRFDMFDVLPVARTVVIDRMADGMVVLDVQHRITDLNDAAGLLLGVSPRRVLGQPAEHVLLEMMQAHPDLLDRIGNPEANPIELSFQASPGRWYQVFTSPVADRRGVPLGYAIWFRDVSEQRDARRKIQEQQRSLTMYEERELLARELHDGIGQLLAAAHLQVRTAETLLARGDMTGVGMSLKRVSRATQDAKEGIRDYLRGVKVGDPGEMGLAKVLGGYLRRCEEDYGFRADLVVASELLARQIDPVVTTRLVPIIQEALTNVRRHGRGAEARVGIDLDMDHIVARIEDNGPGFDPDSSEVRQGYGLRSMRGRAQAAGGLLEIVSTPGQGTRVTVRIPHHKEQA